MALSAWVSEMTKKALGSILSVFDKYDATREEESTEPKDGWIVQKYQYICDLSALETVTMYYNESCWGDDEQRRSTW